MADNAALLAVYTKLEQKIAAIDVRQGGPMGPQGQGGIKGEKGHVGNTGKQGTQGKTGVPGNKGAPGARGLTGATGSQGKDGRQGPGGTAGPQGNNGPMGPVGPQGHVGHDGVGISDAQIDMDGSLTLYMTDGSEIDAGMVGMGEDGSIVYSSSGGLPDSWKNKLDDHIADFNNPHQTSLVNLIDTLIVDPEEGQGIWWDEDTQLWKNRGTIA
ncbi:unnamed protein product, partial [marine sediment metagenome]